MTTFTQPDLMPALPEMVMLGMTCLVLVVDLFLSQEKRGFTLLLTVAALVLTIFAVLAVAPVGAVSSFGGSFVLDQLAVVLKIATCAIAILVFVYSRDYLSDHDIYKGEYYVLGLFATLGMMVMISAHSFLLIYLGLELLSLSLYAMIAFNRNSLMASESAMKYFVLGAMASGLLLYGISIFYGITGTLDLNQVAAAVDSQMSQHPIALGFALTFIVVGLSFKLGAVPFHMWLPDVYQGARTPVTLYLASAPKLAAFALFFRILIEGLGSLHETWSTMIMFVAVLSIIVGNFVAIAQTNIKRMLGYSTIAHVGFILLAFYTGTEEGYAAGLFYALTYVVAAAGAFGIVILLSRRGYDAEHLSDFKGLNARSPWFALMMLFLMFSMAGVPPFVGFLSKLYVISAVLDVGATWLAVLMVIASVIGAYYYLRAIWYMYFEDGEDQAVLQARGDTRLVLSLNSVAVLALGVVPGWLLALCVDVLS